jgi:DNA repair exonuclease SbcCD ATPase subunit
MELAVAVLPGMSLAVGQANEEKILARQDTLVWMRSVDALIRTARKDNEALAQRWRDEQTNRSDVERQASAEEAKKRKSAQDAKLQIEGIEPRLAERAIQLQTLKDQIRPWDERVAVLDVEAAKFEAEASFANRGLDRTRVRGCGNEVCKPALKNAAGDRKKIADIQKELTPKHDELARITAEIEVIRRTLSGLREQAAYLSGRANGFRPRFWFAGPGRSPARVRKRPVLERDQSRQGLVQRLAAGHTRNEARERLARERPMRSAILRFAGPARPPR